MSFKRFKALKSFDRNGKTLVDDSPVACLDTQKIREQLDETFRYYGKIFSTKPYPTLEGLALAAQLFKKDRPDAKDVRPADYVVNMFIDEMENDGFLARVFSGRQCEGMGLDDRDVAVAAAETI